MRVPPWNNPHAWRNYKLGVLYWRLEGSTGLRPVWSAKLRRLYEVSRLERQIKTLEAKPDSDIDYSDIPSAEELPERLEHGAVGRFFRPV